MEITTYLRIIARYWWVILLTTLVSTGVALAITETKAKSYTVHVRVVAQPASVVSNTNELINMSGQIGTREVMGTLAEAFTSADVQSNALAKAGMHATQAPDYPIQANGLPDSSVIEVTGTGHDPVLLTNYVNATVDAGVKYGSGIYRVIDLVPMERASVPAAPTSPVPSRDVPLGAGLGLALGLLLAFATDYMRTPRATGWRDTNTRPALQRGHAQSRRPHSGEWASAPGLPGKQTTAHRQLASAGTTRR